MYLLDSDIKENKLLDGNDSQSTAESSASKNIVENASNPAPTVSTDTPPAETPKNHNIEPRRTRRIQEQAAEGHYKEHWSLRTGLYEDEVDDEDDDSVWDSFGNV